MKNIQTKNPGFTIVELLIVIVVIGILAAITTVAYNGIQGRAYDTSVQNDIRNFAKIVEMKNAVDSAYPFPITSSMGVKVGKDAYKIRNNLYYCVNSTTNQFAIGAVSASGKGYDYSSATGNLQEYSNGDANISGHNTCTLIGLGWSTAYGAYALTSGGTWAGWVN